jgi:hypothetical protein
MTFLFLDHYQASAFAGVVDTHVPALAPCGFSASCDAIVATSEQETLARIISHLALPLPPPLLGRARSQTSFAVP